MAPQQDSPFTRHLQCEARKLRKSDSSLSQLQALDKAAQDNGFENWRHFLNSPQAQIPASHQVTVKKCWYEMGREFWEESITLQTSHPLSELTSEAAFRSQFDRHAELDLDAGVVKLSTAYIFTSEHDSTRQRITRNEVATIARKIMFMDATGLKPSRAWFGPMAGFEKLVDRGSKPPCFDHTHVWKDTEGRFLITTEPYLSKYQEEYGRLTSLSKAAGYEVDLTTWPGMHNPDRNDTSRGTVLLLVSPGKSGIPVSAIKSMLDQLPASHLPNRWEGQSSKY